MRKLVMGFAVVALLPLSAPSEAVTPAFVASPAPVVPPNLPRSATEFGLASWYGEECQGNLTASGEIFDMNGLTAAHRELPLGATIKVTNLRNSRSLVLRVNDRGPNISGRFLDVSMAAAKRLGFLGSGVTLVQVEVVSYPKGYPTGYVGQQSPPTIPAQTLNSD